MTDDEVLGEAHVDGFELIERMSAGQWAIGWARGDDDRWPCFLEERQTVNWMRDRLSRGRVSRNSAGATLCVVKGSTPRCWRTQ